MEISNKKRKLLIETNLLDLPNEIIAIILNFAIGKNDFDTWKHELNLICKRILEIWQTNSFKHSFSYIHSKTLLNNKLNTTFYKLYITESDIQLLSHVTKIKYLEVNVNSYSFGESLCLLERYTDLVSLRIMFKAPKYLNFDLTWLSCFGNLQHLEFVCAYFISKIYRNVFDVKLPKCHLKLQSVRFVPYPISAYDKSFEWEMKNDENQIVLNLISDGQFDNIIRFPSLREFNSPPPFAVKNVRFLGPLTLEKPIRFFKYKMYKEDCSQIYLTKTLKFDEFTSYYIMLHGWFDVRFDKLIENDIQVPNGLNYAPVEYAGIGIAEYDFPYLSRITKNIRSLYIKSGDSLDDHYFQILNRIGNVFIPNINKISLKQARLIRYHNKLNDNVVVNSSLSIDQLFSRKINLNKYCHQKIKMTTIKLIWLKQNLLYQKFDSDKLFLKTLSEFQSNYFRCVSLQLKDDTKPLYFDFEVQWGSLLQIVFYMYFKICENGTAQEFMSELDIGELIVMYYFKLDFFQK